MNKEEIKERVKKVISESLGVKIEDVISGAKLIDDLQADSLDLLELAMELEREFNIEILDEDLGWENQNGSSSEPTVQSIIDVTLYQFDKKDLSMTII